MAVFRNNARLKADRIAALVAGVAFLLGILALAWGYSATTSEVAAPTAVSTTVVSSPIPGADVTMTVQHTAPPLRPTLAPVVTQETTTTSQGSSGSVVVTTAPASTAVQTPFLGSRVANLVFQLLLVTLTALLLAIATQRILLGEFGGRSPRAAGAAGALPVVGEDKAAAVKADIADAGEVADLSRPLYEKGGITDVRLRLLQSRIALELEVRKLAQNNDLPSGLTIPYVVAGLVEKKQMSDRLGAAVSALSSIGDRLGLGAELSPDSTTLLTESYAQALAKVGGRIKK